MTDLEVLLLVLAVIYLWECVHWLRRGTVAFLTRWGRHWRLVHPTVLIGNQNGGFVLAHPFPPLGNFLTGNQSPLSISPEGVFSYVAQCVNPGWRPVQLEKFVPFEAIQKIESSGRQVRVNDRLLVKTGSPSLAVHLSGQVRRLSQLPPEARAAAIREMLGESLDMRAIQQRLADFRRHVPPIQICANLLFAYLFFVAPIWVWQVGFKRGWI